MKKIVLFFLAVCMGVSSAYAQTDETYVDDQSNSPAKENENKPLHPTAGDIAIGIEASPVLNFIGNMFNGTKDQKSNSHWDSHYTVSMRYYLEDNLAVRAAISFNPQGWSLNTATGIVTDDAKLAADPRSTATLKDVKKYSENDWMFSAGAMLFRGKNRLRGFFGGDLSWQIRRKTTKYVYGNPMNQTYPTPTTTDFKVDPAVAAPMAKRTLEEKGGVENTIGINGFTGVEYYIIPQICIGFEVGVRFAMSFTSTGKQKVETMDGTNLVTRESDMPDASTKIQFATKEPFYGNFFLMFHF